VTLHPKKSPDVSLGYDTVINTAHASGQHPSRDIQIRSRICLVPRAEPRQCGTGGKMWLGQIAKRGDPYLRTVLIHGARSVMRHTRVPTAWQKAIQERRPARRGNGPGKQDGMNCMGYPAAMPSTVSLIIGLACSRRLLQDVAALRRHDLHGKRASLSRLRVPCWPSAVTLSA